VSVTSLTTHFSNAPLFPFRDISELRNQPSGNFRVVRNDLKSIRPRIPLNRALVEVERARCPTWSVGAISLLNRNESSEAKAFAQERQVI
jgi:hypothetical protein